MFKFVPAAAAASSSSGPHLLDDIDKTDEYQHALWGWDPAAGGAALTGAAAPDVEDGDYEDDDISTYASGAPSPAAGTPTHGMAVPPPAPLPGTTAVPSWGWAAPTSSAGAGAKRKTPGASANASDGSSPAQKKPKAPAKKVSNGGLLSAAAAASVGVSPLTGITGATGAAPTPTATADDAASQRGADYPQWIANESAQAYTWMFIYPKFVNKSGVCADR